MTDDLTAPQCGIPLRERVSCKVVIGASLGNMLEFYDFGVYGFFAATIGANFFAPTDPASSLLASFAVFGVGFVARPLGGVVMGFVADKKGRRFALMMSILSMALGTLMIGISPTYQTVGRMAPVILVLGRLIQGFSTGGESSVAIAFLVEWAPENRRGLYGTAQQSSGYIGTVFGSTFAAVLSSMLSEAQIHEWGWRVPFLLGALIGPIGYFLRRTISETPAFKAATARPATRQPAQWGAALRVFSILAVTFVVTYTFLLYMPTFTQKYCGLTHAESLWSNSIALVIFCFVVPVTGMISDRFGRKPMLLIASLLFLLLSYPLVTAMVNHPGFATVITVQIALDLIFAIYAGAATAACVEQFPTINRMRWFSPAYNVAGIVFGAFAPYIATWLVVVTGTPESVVYFVLLATVTAMLGILAMRETAHAPLR